MKAMHFIATLWIALTLLLPASAGAAPQKAKNCCRHRAECACCIQPASTPASESAVSPVPSRTGESAPLTLLETANVAPQESVLLSLPPSHLLAVEATRHRLIYQRACSLLL